MRRIERLIPERRGLYSRPKDERPDADDEPSSVWLNVAALVGLIVLCGLAILVVRQLW